MIVKEEAKDFDARHGGNAILGDRHMILLPDGAMRENSAFGVWIEPSSDPWQRAKDILYYHETKLRKAMGNFDEWRQYLERHCEASMRNGNPPPTEEDMQKLEQLREVVKICRAAVAEAAKAVDAYKPIVLQQREDAEARNRERTGAFLDKLAKVRV